MTDYFINQFYQYYGTDWIATIGTIIYLYMIGNKQRAGFLVGIVSNIFWFIFGLIANSFPNLLAQVLFIWLNIRAYRKWSSDSDNQDLSFVVDSK